MSTSVLLADFQFLTREGITSLIDSLDGFQVDTQVKERASLKPQIEKRKPDLVVLDVSSNDHELIDELEKIRASTDSTFLVISNNQDKNSVQRLIGMGIKGIVTKNCSEEEITNALNAVIKGNRFFCNNVLDLVVNGSNDDDDCEPTNLSPREYEVLQLITKGLKTNQIADQLHVSVHTINSHRKSILKKLNLKSPAELIVYALESGLVR